MDNIISPNHEAVGSLVPMENNDLHEQKQAVQKKLIVSEGMTKFLLGMRDKYRKLHQAEWLDIKRQMIKNRKYYDGEQFGYVSDGLEWRNYEKDAGEITYKSNIYSGHIQTMLMELTKGNTEFNFSHISPDSQRGSMIAKVAETRWLNHKRKLFDSIITQQENLSLLLNGIGMRYTYFDWCSESKEKIPNFANKQVAEGQKALVCAMCYAPRDVKSPEMAEMAETESDDCSKCGSNQVKEIGMEGFETLAVDSYQNAKQGENKWVTVDPVGVTFYLHAKNVKESPYILWKQVILTDILQSMFQETPIDEGVQSKELKMQTEQGSSTPSDQRYLDGIVGHSSGDSVLSEFEQGWFDVSLYGERVTDAEITLRSGQKIPSGTKLKEAFPHGLYLATNGNKILDVWSENKNDKWTIAPFVSRLGTMVGAGTSVAVDYQDVKNDLTNLKMASAYQDAFAKEFVNAQYLDPDQIPNNPRERGVVNNLPQGMNIVGGAIERLPPSQLSSEVYALDEQFQGEMQLALGTFAGNQTGAPDLKAAQDTASGMMMWREMAVGRFSPMLEVRADALEKEQIYQFLLNDQKHLTPEQWEMVKSDYGEESVKAFLEADLRKELIIEVVADSYMPQSSAVKQANLAGYGKFMLESQMSPESEMGAYVATQFQIPKTLVGFNAHYDTANKIINLFKAHADAIIQQFGDAPNFDLQDEITANLAMLIVGETNQPIDVEMDNHEAMMDAYKDWWAKDMGRNAPNLLKASVLLRFNEHKAGLVQKAQSDMMAQMEAQAPMMEQQQAQAQQQQMAEQGQAEMQNQAQTEQSNIQMAQDEANRQHALTVKGVDVQEAERQRQHELELEDKRAKVSK